MKSSEECVEYSAGNRCSCLIIHLRGVLAIVNLTLCIYGIYRFYSFMTEREIGAAFHLGNFLAYVFFLTSPVGSLKELSDVCKVPETAIIYY